MVLLARTDWLVRQWLASNIHFRAAEETKSRVDNLISDHFLVYRNIEIYRNYLVFFGFCVFYAKKLFTSVSVKVADIYLYFNE